MRYCLRDRLKVAILGVLIRGGGGGGPEKIIKVGNSKSYDSGEEWYTVLCWLDRGETYN